MLSNFYELFLYFLLYSMLGWLCEEIYCSVPAGRIVNRGVLHGPYCPIYGFGGLAVLFLLQPFRGHVVLVFLAGMLVTSLLEYITSYIMEKIFHSVWWDYSDHRFNINGRVCLLNSFLFGVLSVLLMYLIHPAMHRLISRIPGEYLSAISTVCMVIFAVDVTSTAHTLSNFLRIMRKMHALREEMSEKLAQIEQEHRAAFTAEFEAKRAALSDYLSRRSGRLLAAFPKLHSAEFDAQLSELRAAIRDRAAEHREARRQKKMSRSKRS